MASNPPPVSVGGSSMVSATTSSSSSSATATQVVQPSIQLVDIVDALQTCQTVTLTWGLTDFTSEMKTSPVALFISENNQYDAGDFQLGNSTAGAIEWVWPKVDRPAGDDYLIQLYMPDSGLSAITAPFQIVNGTDTSCLTTTPPPISSHLIGEIIGGIIGGLILVVLGSLFVIYRRRSGARRRSFPRMPATVRLAPPARPPSPAKSDITIITEEHLDKQRQFDFAPEA